jgi:peptidoglycan/LPS O-acetylase OafA/YrhL
VYFGSSSYGLYLIHGPAEFVFVALKSGARITAGAFDLFYFILLFGLVELNFRYLETPLRERGKTIAQALHARIAASRFSNPNSNPTFRFNASLCLGCPEAGVRCSFVRSGR